MVKRCSHGLCNSDDRYPDRLVGGVKFVPFPKPKSDYEKCLRWIRLCGRPHDQLNPSNINSNRYVCTKHFVNQTFPSGEHPDPLPADRFCKPVTSSRKPPAKRKLSYHGTQSLESDIKKLKNGGDTSTGEETLTGSLNSVNMSQSTSSQTSSSWVDPMDLMALIAENEILKRDIFRCTLELIDTRRKLKECEEKCEDLQKLKTVTFTINVIQEDKKLVHYYTGFSKETFCAIFHYLVPDVQECPLKYLGKGKLSKIKLLSLFDQLFLTFCKLRNDFDLQDLAFRFGITQQVAGVIFNSWMNYMFLRFGEICIWPHRDVLIENMPVDYRNEFPNTFPIVDCTEIKIQKPSSMKAQSQTYSDYKSSNTLKALVAVDPRGSVIFSSMLFSGAMSDKEIFKQSGFKSTLEQLLEIGYLRDGDGIMADKGFDIVAEVEETGLKLNIPPFAKSGVQMSQHDVIFTQKIAGHRVHVERAIRRIKSFKILSGRIPLSMLSAIDQIWYVCSVLTNFMPPCIRRK